MEKLLTQVESRGFDRHVMAPSTIFVSHETYTPARGGSAAAEISALALDVRSSADQVVITNTKGFTGHAMGAGIEDVVAIKALETGIVPPVPNFKEPDPELGTLNLSVGGAYPAEYALRLAAGFGSQVAMAMLRWTPMPDRQRRSPDQLGFAYRIADPAVWQALVEPDQWPVRGRSRGRPASAARRRQVGPQERAGTRSRDERRRASEDRIARTCRAEARRHAGASDGCCSCCCGAGCRGAGCRGARRREATSQFTRMRR